MLRSIQQPPTRTRKGGGDDQMSNYTNLNHTRALSAATSRHGVIGGLVVYILALVRLVG